MLRKCTKGVACILACALAWGMVSGTGFSVNATEEIPEEITLPISIVDYDADNLLFQYDLGDSIGAEFAFTSANFQSAVPGSSLVPLPYQLDGQTLYYMEGLVEPELENGLPKYTRATVEKVAELVQAQLVKPSGADTSVPFTTLRNNLVVQEPGALSLENLTDYSTVSVKKYFYDYGWQIEGTGYTQEEGVIKNANGDVIWKQMGDGIHYYGDGNAEHILTLTATGLDPAKNYRAKVWKGLEAGYYVMGVDFQLYNGSTLINHRNDTGNMEFTGLSEVTLKIVPTPGTPGNGEKIAAMHLAELVQTVSGSDTITTEEYVYDNILMERTINRFDNSGWKAVNPAQLTVSGGDALCEGSVIKWQFQGDGLESYSTTSSVYHDFTLRAGKQYLISYLGAGAMDIDIYNGDGSNQLIKQGVKSGNVFTAPTGGQVRIVVKGSGEAYKTYAEDPTWWQRNKLAKMALTEVSCPLGTYEASEAKYADKTKGFDDISTCMDYAYYMLNNLFFLRDDTTKHVYDGYQTLTLSQTAPNTEQYEFVADISQLTDASQHYDIVYDASKKDIKNNRSLIAAEDGLFPVDGSSSTDTRYPGITTGQSHNYHYALSSHAYFYYEEDKDLYFKFIGDDDVYLFINGKLALDLGGAHLAATQTVRLNDVKAQLGLEDGEIYQFDFFYLERCTDYSNFYVSTNIRMLDAGMLEMNYYDSNGAVIPSGSEVEKGTEVTLEYKLTSNVNGLKDITFTDDALGVTVGTNGLVWGNAVQIPESGITVIHKDASAQQDILKNITSDAEMKSYFNNLVLDEGDTVVVKGFLYKVENGLANTVKVTYNAPLYAGAFAQIKAYEDTVNGVLTAKTTIPENSGPGDSNNQGNQGTQNNQNAQSGSNTGGSGVTKVQPANTGDNTFGVVCFVMLIFGIIGICFRTDTD